MAALPTHEQRAMIVKGLDVSGIEQDDSQSSHDRLRVRDEGLCVRSNKSHRDAGQVSVCCGSDPNGHVAKGTNSDTDRQAPESTALQDALIDKRPAFHLRFGRVWLESNEHR